MSTDRGAPAPRSCLPVGSSSVWDVGKSCGNAVAGIPTAVGYASRATLRGLKALWSAFSSSPRRDGKYVHGLHTVDADGLVSSRALPLTGNGEDSTLSATMAEYDATRALCQLGLRATYTDERHHALTSIALKRDATTGRVTRVVELTTPGCAPLTELRITAADGGRPAGCAWCEELWPGGPWLAAFTEASPGTAATAVADVD